MPHIHWVARQNKLELPNDEEEVNTRDIHNGDGQAHDPDTMAAPLTPEPTRKAEALAKAPPTIASRRKEDARPAFGDLLTGCDTCTPGLWGPFDLYTVYYVLPSPGFANTSFRF
jgi:hypothetical protein